MFGRLVTGLILVLFALQEQALCFNAKVEVTSDAEGSQNATYSGNKTNTQASRPLQESIFSANNDMNNTLSSSSKVSSLIHERPGATDQGSTYPSDSNQQAHNQSLHKFEPVFGADVEQPQNKHYDDEEEFLCNSIEKIVYPETALTSDYKMQAVLQNANYRQSVRVEECVRANMPCRYNEAFPNNFHTICKQTYGYRQLVTMSSNGSIITENFRIPAACKCAVVKRFF